jgi:hypothetical protein
VSSWLSCANFLLLVDLTTSFLLLDNFISLIFGFDRHITVFSNSYTKMAQQYASKQPQGFKNHIEKIAIVGVSWDSLKTTIGCKKTVHKAVYQINSKQ